MDPLSKRLRAAQAAAGVGIDAGKFTDTLVVRPRGQADSRPLRSPRPGPGSTRRWPLKTDAKDALGITDLTAQGHFVGFPFPGAPYAELRYLMSARERLRNTAPRDAHPAPDDPAGRLPRVRAAVWPLHQADPARPAGRVPRPGGSARRAATESAGGAGRGEPRASGRGEIRDPLRSGPGDAGTKRPGRRWGCPARRAPLREEIPLLLELWRLVDRQRRTIDRMQATLAPLPEAPALLSIPLVAPVTAAPTPSVIG